MGKYHNYLPPLNAILDKVMGQDRGSLEDLSVCESALWGGAGSGLDNARAVRMLSSIGSKDLMDGTLEVRPEQVCCRVWDISLGEGSHGWILGYSLVEMLLCAQSNQRVRMPDGVSLGSQGMRQWPWMLFLQQLSKEGRCGMGNGEHDASREIVRLMRHRCS